MFRLDLSLSANPNMNVAGCFETYIPINKTSRWHILEDLNIEVFSVLRMYNTTRLTYLLHGAESFLSS